MLTSALRRAFAAHVPRRCRGFQSVVTPLLMNTDSVTIIKRGPFPPPILVSCEHASNTLPAGYCWSSEDEWLTQSHWASDPGSLAMTLDLTASLGCGGILSNYSRLYVDVNRPLSSSSLIRTMADGRQIRLNSRLTKQEVESRLLAAYIPYHLSFGELVMEQAPRIIVSLHSFNPVYEGEVRDFDVGVLSSVDDRLALKVLSAFTRGGFRARLNEPWSGKDGFMFALDSARVAGNTRGSLPAHCLLIECRNDNLQDPLWRARANNILAAELTNFVADVATD